MRRIYQSLDSPRQLTPDEIPFAEFLRKQGALTLQFEPTPVGLSLQPAHWSTLKQAGIYTLAGDGQGGSWSYNFLPGLACLNCVLYWWVLRYHSRSWLERIKSWPDFCLSWKTEALPELPEPGRIHYRCKDKVYRGRVFPHPECGCGGVLSGRPGWSSWAHPVTGPLSGIVEHKRDGLWRVSLHLQLAAASGASLKRKIARRAALAEACERWAALQPCEHKTVAVYPLHAGGRSKCWSGLVYLGDVPVPGGHRLPPQQLSHGLACGSTAGQAVRAGFWELFERDSLRRWWQAWVTGRPYAELQHLDDNLWALPGPVYLAFQGHDGRGAWGSAAGACGLERARNEARHNYQVLFTNPPLCPKYCESFADHAAWGWHHPVPRWKELQALPLTAAPVFVTKSEILARYRVYYRPLPCFFAKYMHWFVVRIVSPDMCGLEIGGSAPFHPFS